MKMKNIYVMNKIKVDSFFRETKNQETFRDQKVKYIFS